MQRQDVLCVADREGRRADCVGAGLRSPQFRGSRTAQLPGLSQLVSNQQDNNSNCLPSPASPVDPQIDESDLWIVK